MKRLSVDQIKALHGLLVVEAGGVAGIRSESMLQRLANTRLNSNDGTGFGPDAEAARLALAIACGRPFQGGNVRTAMLVLLTFLEVNGAPLNCGDNDIVTAGRRLGAGEMTFEELLVWISGFR